MIKMFSESSSGHSDYDRMMQPLSGRGGRMTVTQLSVLDSHVKDFI